MKAMLIVVMACVVAMVTVGCRTNGNTPKVIVKHSNNAVVLVEIKAGDQSSEMPKSVTPSVSAAASQTGSASAASTPTTEAKGGTATKTTTNPAPDADTGNAAKDAIIKGAAEKANKNAAESATPAETPKSDTQSRIQWEYRDGTLIIEPELMKRHEWLLNPSQWVHSASFTDYDLGGDGFNPGLLEYDPQSQKWLYKSVQKVLLSTDYIAWIVPN